METYNFPHVVPHLVEDNSLKRARTTVIEGGQEKEAIQVTPVGAPTVDAQTIADGMGKAPASTANNSVCDKLKDIQDEVLTTKNNTVAIYNTNNAINNTCGAIVTTGTTIYTSLGQKNDAAWGGSGNGSVIAIEKGIYGLADSISYNVGNCDSKLYTIQNNTDYIPQMSNNVSDTKDAVQMIDSTVGSINGYVGNVDTVLGTTSTSAIAPTSNGAINGRLRQISTVQGTASDAAWGGSGDGTVIALLKGIYNKL